MRGLVLTVSTLKTPVLLDVTLCRWPVDSGVPKDYTTFRNALFWVTT